MRLSRMSGRVTSRNRQRGFIRLPTFIAQWGAQPFTIRDLFKGAEPGLHFETYDPATILRRRNLLTWSEALDNSIWIKGSTTTVTANTGTAPDGTASADRINMGADASTSAVYYNTVTAPTQIGGVYTASIYLWADAGQATSVYFQAVDSAVGVVSGGLVAINTGLQRFTVTFTATTATSGIRLRCGTGQDNKTVYAWGAQLEKGAVATAYQAVTDWNTEFLAAGGDRITMFTDNTCTTPVTAVEQVIGGFVSSERGTAKSANLYAGADIVGVAIGGPAFTNYATGLTATPGKSYEFVVDVTDYAGSGTCSIGGIFGTDWITATVATSGNGRWRFVVTALTAISIMFFTRSTNTAAFRNISIRQLPGSVATQSTSGFRPKLEARVNLLVSTEDIENAAWTKTNGGTGVLPVVTRNYGSVAAPDGTFTAQRIQFNKGAGTATTDTSEVYQNPALPSTNTRKTWARTVSGTANVIVGGGVPQALDTTWRLVSLSAATAERPRFMIRGGQTPACPDTADILIWHPDVRSDADAALNIPAYQRVNSSTDYDTDGFPMRCRGDGVDDYLSVPLNMSGTNAVDTWVAGSIKTSDAASTVVFEFTATSTTTPGSFGLIAPNGGVTDVQFRSGGTTPGIASSSGAQGTYPGPLNAVVTGRASISAPSIAQELNGVGLAANTASQGTGNYANDTLYIHARAGTSLRSTCGWSSLTIRGAATTAALKARMNRYAAGIAKIFI